MPATASRAARSRSNARQATQVDSQSRRFEPGWIEPKWIEPKWIEPRYALLTAAVAVIILYGSLFPFDFDRNTRPIQTIWDYAQIPTERMDIVSNVLLYWPLGVSFVLAFRGWGMRQRVASAMLCGAA